MSFSRFNDSSTDYWVRFSTRPCSREIVQTHRSLLDLRTASFYTVDQPTLLDFHHRRFVVQWTPSLRGSTLISLADHRYFLSTVFSFSRSLLTVAFVKVLSMDQWNSFPTPKTRKFNRAGKILETNNIRHQLYRWYSCSSCQLELNAHYGAVVVWQSCLSTWVVVCWTDAQGGWSRFSAKLHSVSEKHTHCQNKYRIRNSSHFTTLFTLFLSVHCTIKRPPPPVIRVCGQWAYDERWRYFWVRANLPLRIEFKWSRNSNQNRLFQGGTEHSDADVYWKLL